MNNVIPRTYLMEEIFAISHRNTHNSSYSNNQKKLKWAHSHIIQLIIILSAASCSFINILIRTQTFSLFLSLTFFLFHTLFSRGKFQDQLKKDERSWQQQWNILWHSISFNSFLCCLCVCVCKTPLTCKSSHLNKFALYCCIVYCISCLTQEKPTKRRKTFSCFLFLVRSIIIMIVYVWVFCTCAKTNPFRFVFTRMKAVDGFN